MQVNDLFSCLVRSLQLYLGYIDSIFGYINLSLLQL